MDSTKQRIIKIAEKLFFETGIANVRLQQIADAAENPPPPTTALGALLAHITGGADERSFQPMNVNFGLFPPLPAGGKNRGKDRKQLLSARALQDLAGWLEGGAQQSAAE